MLKQNGTGNTLVYIDFEKENKNKLGYLFLLGPNLLIYKATEQISTAHLHFFQSVPN